MTKVVKTKAENVTEMVISQEVTPNLNWMKQTGVASVEEVQKLRDVIESGVSGGDTITAALNAHISNTNNPHEVTPGKIGAAPSSLTETVAALDLKLTNQISTHIDNKDNPHEVTPGKIGAAAAEHTHTAQEVTGILTEEMLLAHTEDTDNPHNVTTTQIGAVAQTAFDGLNQTVTNHISDLNNPHGVTTTQIGAATKNEVDSIKTDLAVHIGNNDNPHGTTAAQIGAPTTEEFDLLEEQVITHTEDTNNPHNVTHEQTGAAPLEHTHKVADITDKENLVQYSTFAETRKTIQLANYDSISGLTTAGVGANLVMLSKWNKADFGSPKVTMNLNTIDNVTINDDKIIATTDQIPDISSLATKESLSSYVTTETAEATYRKNNVNLTTSDITNFTSEVAKIKVNSATSADMASSVAWENVQNAPTALPNPNALTIKYNGVQAFTYDGSKAETGNFTVTAETVPGVAKATDLELYRKKSDVLTSADISDFTSVVTSTKVDAAQVADVANSVSWDDVTGKPDMVITAAGNVQALADRLELVETQLTDLKKTNVVPVVMDSAANLNQPDADMVITAAADPIEGIKNVVAKSIDVKSMSASNAVVGMTATNDINVQSVSLTGNLPKETSNAQLKINTSEYVKITKSTFAQTGYNAVEVGLQTAPKNVIIDGLDFTVPLSNNAILIFQHQDDAVITISNCHFADVSNAVRISNKLNKRATVNIINCTVDKWDARSEWAGFLIMQDYTSGSVEAEETNNLFAPDKLTINFINVVGPDGKVIKPTNLAEVCGTSDENQIIYVWNSKGGTIPYGDGSRYPTFTFK